MSNSIAIQELLRRTTRIESRIVKLAEGMHVSVKLPPAIRVQIDPSGECRVIVDSAGVEIAAIASACQKHGALDTWAAIYHGGQWIAQVYIE